MQTLDDVISRILKSEGGFVDHPADKGGATNFGITQATLGKWRGHPVTADDVRGMREAEARQIYREQYGAPLEWLLDAGKTRTFPLAFDMAVNHGPANLARMLQKIAGAFPDGVIGPSTKAKALLVPDDRLFEELLAARMNFIGSILSSRHDQVVFAKGWLARCASFLE